MRRKTKEEYVETIYVLEKQEGRAHTARIAAQMDVKPASVTEILKKLQSEGLVRYKLYAGATLTKLGKKMAEELMKRHQVIADFLKIIGVKRDLAELDACKIEHHVTEETTAQLEKFVEFMHATQRDPKWIRYFRQYCKTGKRSKSNGER